VVAGSLCFLPKDPSPWVKDDQAWFAEHPDRSHRVRPVYVDEWPPEMRATATVIKQFEPGVRQRLCASLTCGSTDALPWPPEGEITEIFAWALFDLLFEANRRGQGFAGTIADVLTRAAALDPAGSA
jgi:hypothetical protein